jgi:uncharacterized glyoxalase superfamily protein PhnB
MSKNLWQSPTVVPEIAYDDVPAAIEFLTRAFGLRERIEARLTGNGFVRAFMELGDGLISLSTAGGHGHQSPRAGGATTQSVKCYVEGIDRHFAQAKANGATIISEPTDEFWGGRIYRAKDPEGHRWEFSERGRELAASEWKLPPGIKLGA